MAANGGSLAAPAPAAPVKATAEVLYIHPGLKLTDLGNRGHGYVASKAIRQGELLLEERPMVWDSGKDPQRPDLSAGVDWLLRTGALHELPGAPEGMQFATERERAEVVASRCAFRNQSPCSDGSFPAMLFRASSRFNHACFPNAGAYAPGGEEFANVADYAPRPMSTYAIEGIKKGEEVCICYLSDLDQLSPATARQTALREGWGFDCVCARCKGGRPLDKRLEGIADAEDLPTESSGSQRGSLVGASREFRALFDPTSEDYNPPKDDFEATVQRLTEFREKNSFLDKAHCIMQRVRRELLAAFLLDGTDGQVGRSLAGPAAELLIEDMRVANELLPLLSPCKVANYARFLRVLRNVPESDAVWLRRNVKVDGVELWHRNALWLHSPAEASKLLDAATEGPRNMPPRPATGLPPRTGPSPRLGACCLVWLGDSEQPSSEGRSSYSCCSARSSRWPRGGQRRRRQAAAAGSGGDSSDDDEMPEMVSAARQEDEADLEPKADRRRADLFEAYGEYGRPSAAARSVRKAAAAGGPGRACDKQEGSRTWFKFKV